MTIFTAKRIFFINIVLILLILYNAIKVTSITQRIVPANFKIRPNGDQTALKSEVTQKIIEDKTENSSMKYILLWTRPASVPFVYIGKGQTGFLERKCPYTNCIATGNVTYLDDITKFDVIAFAGPEVIRLHQLPIKRSPHQKYVFASIESSDYYPTCSSRFDNYFNWTWTYKLDSEVQWGYFAIRDKNNVKIGPKKEMHWLPLKDMDPVSDEFKEQLKTKTKAAAWFVSNCYSRSLRERKVKELQMELSKYNMSVDVYGRCGNFTCSRDNEDACDQIVKKTYYFYLSYENSFSEDYVTEKLLRALNSDAIPIVYGGANYTRFMPDGIYLNARELSVTELAAKMVELINDPEKYAEYFKWKNHYSYHRQHESVETEPYCLFCTTLNKEDMVKKTSVYKNFREWWDPPGRC